MRRMARVAWLAALLLVATHSVAQSGLYIPEPASSGHQLIFVYDARDGRTTFLTVSATILPAPASVSRSAASALPGQSATIEIAFYPLSLAARLGDRVVAIGDGETIVIDPRAPEYAAFAAGQAGLVVVTPIVSESDRHPIALNGALLGSFTIANTNLGAGFGGTAAARDAVDRGGAIAPGGAIVDGSDVRYQRIAPRSLTLNGFFNPATLGRPEDDGNRVLIAAFDDVYGTRFDVQPQRVLLFPTFSAPRGAPLAGSPVCTDGIVFTSLQALAAPSTLDAAGYAGFRIQGPMVGNLFGFFAESLGTYGAGQRLTSNAATVPRWMTRFRIRVNMRHSSR